MGLVRADGRAPTRATVDVYVAVAIVLWLVLLLQTLNRRWSPDYWLHQATLDAFRRDLWHPKQPLVGTHDPFEYYSPYTFVLAVVARVSALPSVVVLQCAAMLNAALFLIAFRLFVGQLTHGLSVTFALIATLVFWGVHPWRWSGLLNFNSIGFGLPYPSMFATALALFAGWAFMRYNATLRWRWLVFDAVALPVVLLTHPFTGVWTGVMFVALAIHGRAYRPPKLLPVALMVVAVAAALAVWPYYPFYRLLFGSAHSESSLLYTQLPLAFFAALPGAIALRRRWAHDRTDPLVLMLAGGVLLYVIGGVTASHDLARVLPVIALPLHIGIAELMAPFAAAGVRASRSLVVTLVICGAAGLVGVSPAIASVVPNRVLPSSVRRHRSFEATTSRYHALSGALPAGTIVVVESSIMEEVVPAHGFYVLATSASAFVPDASARRRASDEILAATTEVDRRDELIHRFDVGAVLCATRRCRDRFVGRRLAIDDWTLIISPSGRA